MADTPENNSLRRQAMVSKQLRAGGIGDERVLAAMGRVPREEFVPEELREHAYVDGALPIRHGQTISQPWVVAAICSALQLHGGERVLDVGGGAGYSTAVIADLVRPGGHVRSYELVEALAIRAEATLAHLGYDEAEVRWGDGAKSTGEMWDAIAVHAAAPEVPGPLIDSLKPGGRLVLPVANWRADVLTAFRRTDDGSGDDVRLEQTEIAECRFVPLLGESGFRSRDR
ncbi:MAG: protein-L-isoaspartate(D-aspartate) O-methyltransferase [Solirubrobacterales bacterium]|jgi:protein-L-isoaspartate(D-aspartate) O-methyltransferase|nr:protein-L-isoaspartate(D-aspartate) O-methyltransferase [Solirubrobacterales bacterium]